MNYTGGWPLRLQVVPVAVLMLLLLPAATMYPVSYRLAEGLAMAGVAGSLLSACWVQWRWYVGGPASSSPRRQRAWRRRMERLNRVRDKRA